MRRRFNYGNYCNRRATTLLDQTATELDENTRTKLLNQAEALMAKDVPSIPMFVRPVFTIAAKKLKGLTTPTTLEGNPWNANTWTSANGDQRVTGACLHDQPRPRRWRGRGDI